LETSYRNMTGLDDSKVTLIFKPSEQVDFSKYDYDLVFTSPPYFMIERYEKMPPYKSKQEFLENFFFSAGHFYYISTLYNNVTVTT